MQSHPRIAFFTLRDSFFDDGECLHDRSNARLINSLVSHYPSLSFITYQDYKSKNLYNERIEANTIYRLPFKNTFFNGILYAYTVVSLLKKIERNHDLLIIQYPLKTFFAPIFLKKPIIGHVCSNLVTASSNKTKYTGIKYLIAGSYAKFLHYCFKRSFKNSNVHVLANGMELTKLFNEGRTEMVISSSISQSEIIVPEEIKIRGSTFEILFVGRPSFEKGLHILLRACEQLGDDHKLQISFVGFGKREFVEMYRDKFDLDSIRIKFLGYIPFSADLFKVYKSADVLVLPSLSEGTPRVLIEARAFGCPIIASRVGGIPDGIEDNVDGLLFEPGNTSDLAKQLELIINNEDFRLRLAVNGLRRVKGMTLEKFTSKFVNRINQILKSDV